MNLLKLVKSLVPQSAKRWIWKFSASSRLMRQVSPYLPELVCVDVGASYYPHAKWRVFLESPQTRWIAVEPNKANVGYIKTWAWQCQVSAVTTGLSQHGGPQTLYVTNVDSGSSLLEPVIAPGLSQRVQNLDYFFPLRTQQIDTLTLLQVLADAHVSAPVFVKLDTQGTELSILSGAQALLLNRRIVGVELESTLLAQPIMQGAGKFWQACEYLEGLGFELLHIKPIYGPSRFGSRNLRSHTYLNECDAVFAIRPDVAKGLAVEYRVALLGFYASNAFFEESLSVLDDGEVKAYLKQRGCNIDKLATTLRAMA